MDNQASALAAAMTGATYRNPVTDEQESAAKAAGLVIVFGMSDDLMEFRGAICDELDACNGGTAHVTREGLLSNDCESPGCPHFAKIKAAATPVHAIWCPPDSNLSWAFKTDIPHATFDMSDDGEPYCRGIVFALSDVPVKA